MSIEIAVYKQTITKNNKGRQRIILDEIIFSKISLDQFTDITVFLNKVTSGEEEPEFDADYVPYATESEWEINGIILEELLKWMPQAKESLGNETIEDNQIYKMEVIA